MNENNVETTSDVGTLDIVIKDPKGLPISDLEFQVFIAGQSVFSGKTDANGNGKTIEGLKIGSIFEVHVKTDKGIFKKVAIGNTQTEECTACLTSPKSRFEFSSYADAGKPGNAEAHKEKVIEGSKQKTAEPANPVIKKPHTVTNDQDKKGKPVALVTNGAKVLPAKAENVLAALPKVDGKPYAAGIDYLHGKNMDVIPESLVCNEYVYHAYRVAGETIPPSMVEQIAYFKRHNRFTTDMATGEVGDIAFFDNPPPLSKHEVIVVNVKVISKTKWYLFSGARNSAHESGILTSSATENHKEEPIYIAQDGKPASLRNNELVMWGQDSTSVRGFKTFVGFGKAGK